MKGLLVLEDGTAFRGEAIGSPGTSFGEIVFNTAMSGYQEVLTDPSYAGQIVVMTASHVGNYGIREDEAESDHVHVAGFVARQAPGDVAVARQDAFDGARELKHDFASGTTEEHDFGAGRSPGEFVFVPSESATSEDDGYLMGFVYDATTDTSDFVILDAHDFGAAPLATVTLPQRVPYGFHGNWMPDPR